MMMRSSMNSETLLKVSLSKSSTFIYILSFSRSEIDCGSRLYMCSTILVSPSLVSFLTFSTNSIFLSTVTFLYSFRFSLCLLIFVFLLRPLLSSRRLLFGIPTGLRCRGGRLLGCRRWCDLLDAICCAEFLYAAFGELLHVLGEFVYVGAGDVVRLAVVSYQLHVREQVLIRLILPALLQALLYRGEIHRPLHYLRVVMQPEFYIPYKWYFACLPCQATGSKKGSAPGSSSMDFSRLRILGKSSFLI